jgi:hypothetical protein
MELSEHGKRKKRFSLSLIFNGLPPLKMAARCGYAFPTLPQRPAHASRTGVRRYAPHPSAAGISK